MHTNPAPQPQALDAPCTVALRTVHGRVRGKNGWMDCKEPKPGMYSGAAWAAGAAGAGAAAAGAGTAYAAGGHSAELDYNGPELAHSAELDYQGGSNEMV